MVALPRYNRTILDQYGNVVPGASVEVRRESPGQPLVQLYSDRAGAVAVGNPISADANGFVFFHVASGEYQVKATFGANVQTLRYEQIGPASIENSMGPETQITGSTYTLGGTETFLTIRRVSPTLTTITLPALATRAGLSCAFVDWSTGMTSDHEIKWVPNGSETVMKDATYSVWSNSSGRARGWIYPSADLSSWIVTS